MPGARLWCRMTVRRPDGSELFRGALDGWGAPDLATVDRIARLALHWRRAGSTLVLSEVSAELAELLDLAGLRVEMEGKAEAREQALGVERRQEEAHPDDLSP
jgi:hypothetical protein